MLRSAIQLAAIGLLVFVATPVLSCASGGNQITPHETDGTPLSEEILDAYLVADRQQPLHVQISQFQRLNPTDADRGGTAERRWATDLWLLPETGESIQISRDEDGVVLEVDRATVEHQDLFRPALSDEVVQVAGMRIEPRDIVAGALADIARLDAAVESGQMSKQAAQHEVTYTERRGVTEAELSEHAVPYLADLNPVELVEESVVRRDLAPRRKSTYAVLRDGSQVVVAENLFTFVGLSDDPWESILDTAAAAISERMR